MPDKAMIAFSAKYGCIFEWAEPPTLPIIPAFINTLFEAVRYCATVSRLAFC